MKTEFARDLATAFRKMGRAARAVTRNLERSTTLFAEANWRKRNPGRRIPGSDRTARLRRKRKKALARELFAEIRDRTPIAK